MNNTPIKPNHIMSFVIDKIIAIFEVFNSGWCLEEYRFHLKSVHNGLVDFNYFFL